MAKVKMKYVRIFAMRENRKRLLKKLQQLSVIDVETASLDEETKACPEDFCFLDKSKEINSFERTKLITKQALDVINEFVPKKKSMLSTLSGRRRVKINDFEYMREHFLQVSQQCHEIVTLQKEILKLRAQRVRIKLLLEQLVPWKDLDVYLSFSGTEKTSAFIGSFPEDISHDDIVKMIAEKSDMPFDFEIVGKSVGMTCVIMVCLNEDAEKMEEILREYGFARPPVASSKTPKKKCEQYNEMLEEIDINERSILDRMSQLAKYRCDIELCHDYELARISRYQAIEHIPHSKYTFVVRGYIKESDEEKLRDMLEKECEAEIETEDANEDLQPVVLENNAFTAPAQPLTKMYALPSSKDVDPTPIMSIFYYIFFGIMLSDAGYGILMAIGSWFLIKKYKPEENMLKNLKLFMYCGISTTIWGFLFGSFFGDSIPVLSKFFTGTEVRLQPLLFDPTKDAVVFLIMSIALGFIQIMVGLGVKFYISWRDGQKFEAIFKTGLWMTLLLGLALLALGLTGLSICTTVGAAVAVASAVGIIIGAGIKAKGVMRLFAGFADLYNITGYASDLMSYSRLMALGLTTGAMGAVFNMLSAMFGKNIVGILVMIVIFIFGHAINIGLNALGSYVHTLRLQYVELFSKFYDGGGRLFKVFSFDGKYVRIEKEGK